MLHAIMWVSTPVAVRRVNSQRLSTTVGADHYGFVHNPRRAKFHLYSECANCLRMLSYSIAKELKNAGFSQSERARAQQQAGYEYVSIPNLAALIEACGGNFGALGRETACWVACEYVSDDGEWKNAFEGETPEDAVARLWLSLNQRAAAEGAVGPSIEPPAKEE